MGKKVKRISVRSGTASSNLIHVCLERGGSKEKKSLKKIMPNNFPVLTKTMNTHRSRSSTNYFAEDRETVFRSKGPNE